MTTMVNQTAPDPASEPCPPLEPAQIYEQLLPEIMAVPAEKLVPINIDIPSAVAAVLGSLPEIRAGPPPMEEMLKSFDFATIDKLEAYTHAVSHAHALYRAAVAPKGLVPAMAAEASVIRDQLHAEALALVAHGVIAPEQIKNCKSGPGYKLVAYDVFTLVAILRQEWSAIAGRTLSTETSLAQAVAVANALLLAVGLREQSPTKVGEISERRNQAFTLFVNAYEKVRRAIAYVRADKRDADEIAPSLYATHTGRRSSTKEEGKAPTTTPTTSPTPPVVETPPVPPTAPIVTAGLPITMPFQS
jgi:hypothetical protein